MRACIISTAHDARDDRLYFKEARSLAKEHKVTLLAPVYRENEPRLDKSICFRRLESSVSKLDRTKAALRLLRQIPHRGYDTIHVVDAELFPFLPVLKLKTRAKTVCDIWEANYELILGSNYSPSLIRQIMAIVWRKLERLIARRCDLVITADGAIAESLGSAVRPTVIYNFPLLSTLSYRQEDADCLYHRLGRKRFITYHGSMAKERGILAAVEMMAYVLEKHPDAVLLLIGSMPETLMVEVRKFVVRNNLYGAIHFTGWVDHSQIGKYLGISKIGLVPFARTRKFEKNIPQKIFEYWAAGVPIVATDLAPIRLFLKQCGGGILTENNNPMILAAAVCELLDQPEVARQMGLQGKEMVEKEWRWERMEEKLLKAYRALGN